MKRSGNKERENRNEKEGKWGRKNSRRKWAGVERRQVGEPRRTIKRGEGKKRKGLGIMCMRG
mgnify:CR=1 FL=1